jgi:hypothetical protein
MDRVLVSHDWMGGVRGTADSEPGNVDRRLFNGVTAV